MTRSTDTALYPQTRSEMSADGAMHRRLHASWILEDARDARIRSLEQGILDLRASLANAAGDADSRMQLSLDAAGLGTWERDLQTSAGHWSARMAALHGVAPDHIPSHEDWLARIDQADRQGMHNAMASLLSGAADHYEASYRYLRPDGAPRWIWSRGAVIQRDPATGRAVRIAGVARDDTEQREMEVRRDLLAREVDHRAKNALAVVQSVVRLTRGETVKDYARAVDGRIAALARAHDLLSRATWTGAGLADILDHELAPYVPGRHADANRGRATFSGPDVTLAASAVQPMSMALHELVTNAAKYGALSTLSGNLHVRWHIEPVRAALRLCWVEQGGPILDARPTRRGFGTRVLDGTIRHQLGGTVQLLWEPEGLVCDIQIPSRQVAAVQPRGRCANG